MCVFVVCVCSCLSVSVSMCVFVCACCVSACLSVNVCSCVCVFARLQWQFIGVLSDNCVGIRTGPHGSGVTIYSGWDKCVVLMKEFYPSYNLNLFIHAPITMNFGCHCRQCTNN